MMLLAERLFLDGQSTQIKRLRLVKAALARPTQTKGARES